jgi:hypothetical protein
VSYAIRRPRLQSLVTVLSFVGFFAFAVLLVRAPTSFLVLAGALAAWNLWSSALVISVGSRGIRFGRLTSRGNTTLLPWSSIREVVLWNAGPAGLGGGEPEVGLRLRPDAPLPDSMGAMIYDPAHADEVPPELRVTVRGLDRAKLEAAVRRHGGGVRLIEA